MKSKKIATEIDAIISEIEGVCEPLHAAVARLKFAKANLNKDTVESETLGRD